MELEHKDAKTAVSDLKVDEKTGIVEALVSITGIKDHVNDVIVPGAYARTLKTRKPKGVAHHEWSAPVAKTLAIEEYMPGDPRLPKKMADGKDWPKEAGALWVKSQFNLKTQRGRDAFEDIMFFDEEAEFSIGYRVPEGKSRKDTKTKTRYIDDLDLFEYSPVLFGAQSGTRMLSSIKSLFETDEEFKAAVISATELKAEPDDEDVIPDTEPDDGMLTEDDKEKLAELVGNEDTPETLDGEAGEKGFLTEEEQVTLADVLAELKTLTAAVSELKSTTVTNIFAPASEEEKGEEEAVEEVKAESSDLRKAMDALINESDFDENIVDAIDNAVLALEASIKAADGEAIVHNATVALDGISKAKDAKPDEKTANDLNALAVQIDNIVKANGGEEKSEEEPEDTDQKPEVKSISAAEWAELLNS